jgi:hypothetical protein
MRTPRAEGFPDELQAAARPSRQATAVGADCFPNLAAARLCQREQPAALLDLAIEPRPQITNRFAQIRNGALTICELLLQKLDFAQLAAAAIAKLMPEIVKQAQARRSRCG